MARRVLTPLLALVLLLGTATLASAKPNLRLDEGTGLELSGGNGRTTVALRGAVIGTVGSGWVWVTDLPGGAETNIVVAGDEDSFQLDTQTTAYRGDNIRFRVFRGKWRVRVRGTEINVSAVGTGWFGIAGRGRYQIEGGPERRWPDVWKTIKLGP